MIIGIIGAAGTGKSTATSFFEKHGAYIIIADTIVKYIYKMPDIEKKIIKVFGDQFLSPENKLDKAKLRKEVFKNETALNSLEAIIWPEMVKIIVEEIKNHSDNKLVVLDCSVLFNAHLEDKVDKVLLIESNEQLKINRIKARDNVSDIEAINLLSIQKKHLVLNKKVDYVVKNNESIESFIKQLTKILKTFN